MTREVLTCVVCSKEVGIVRLNAATLTFGHRINPKNQRHPVRLARTTDERSTSQAGLAVSGDIRRSSEGAGRLGSSTAEHRLAIGSPEVAGSNPALGPAPSSDPAPVVAGRPRARGVHAGSTSVTRLPRERASQSVPAPFRTVTPRVPSAAGRRPT